MHERDAVKVFIVFQDNSRARKWRNKQMADVLYILFLHIQVLYALGDRHACIETIEKALKTAPDFKRGKAILAKWTAEKNEWCVAVAIRLSFLLTLLLSYALSSKVKTFYRVN